MVLVAVSRYGLFAAQNGGFDRVGFMKQDMYNQQRTKRGIQSSDATAVLAYLESLSAKDDRFYWNHIVNEEDGRLQTLFWCDGPSRMDYSVFGDVLAFDATYKKNKYLCPLVIFSGVNHHNQSVIFAAAIVTDESEPTYVWLLENLLAAMDGKSPASIITDGALQMKNAIKKVFPNAHHRLCAWHLLRNAVSNVKNTEFVSRIKPLMLGDMDVDQFEMKWAKMVADLGLEENTWVLELYQRKEMWATAHIRGQFFAGFRTTSRCEGLHSEFGKYVTVRNNLLEFIEQFVRWLEYMRFRETAADFISAHGEPVLQTQFKSLEKSASEFYTREIFNLFLPILQRVYACRVVGFFETETEFIYTVVKSRKHGYEWQVSFLPATLEFKCSCQRLESLGLPCEHMLYIIWYLDIVNLPDCVVMKRWTKKANLGFDQMNNSGSVDPRRICKHKIMVDCCYKLAMAGLDCPRDDLFRRTHDIVMINTQRLEAARRGEDVVLVDPDRIFTTPATGVQNPFVARSRGGVTPRTPRTNTKTPRKPTTCGKCGRRGHKRNTCRFVEENSNTNRDSDENEHLDQFDYSNVQTNAN